jgi:hypothetical protein
MPCCGRPAFEDYYYKTHEQYSFIRSFKSTNMDNDVNQEKSYYVSYKNGALTTVWQLRKFLFII